MTDYFWDYYGPDAEGIARHFLAHLREYLARAAVPGLETGVESSRPGHCAAWCRAPESARDALLRLRPHRAQPAP